MACFDFYFAMVALALSKADPSLGAKYKLSCANYKLQGQPPCSAFYF
jgi:hypothetical protein